MAYWGAGAAGGWSGGMGPGGPGQRLRRSTDGWDDEEYGSLYNHRVMTRLIPYLRPFKFRTALALIGMLGFAAAVPVQALLIGTLIDAASDGDLGKLNRTGFIFLGLVLFSWGAYWVQLTNTGWIGHRILFTLRTQMFNHLQKLSLRFYDGNEVGRVMSRITSDVTTLQELLTSGMITILADFVGLFVVVGIMLYLDAELALITFAVVPFLVAAMAIWQAYARRSFIRVRQAIAIVNASLQENVSGVRVIQSLSREAENSKRFDTVNRDNLMANVVAGRVTAIVMPLVELSVAIATALVIVYGGYKVLDGAMSVGVVVTFALSVQRFFDPVRDLVLQYTQIQRAMAGGERIFEVLDTEPEIQDAADAVELEDVRGEVTFEHVDFEYAEGVPVLRDFSLHVNPGETVAFVGPTGAGKTTITSLAARFYDVTGGRILVDGHDIRHIKRQSLARRMGLVLQEAFLFSGTVLENICYGRPEATREDAEKAARAVGAHDFIARLELGYDTVLHERGQNVSVGQRQLISFARAVLADPRILILDEATANVDTRTEAVIQQALRELLRNRTSFVIAHRLSTIRSADRVIVLDQGHIAEQGTHDELLATDGLYAKLYQMTYQERNGEGEPHFLDQSKSIASNGGTPAPAPAKPSVS
ncbi:MAG: ABC transporter ATP-binding protein [Dehalococcoidia bacterium]